MRSATCRPTAWTATAPLYPSTCSSWRWRWR